MGRDIMPPGTIGGLLDMGTTGVPIGGTGTGEITDGIGIDSAIPQLTSQLRRQINQIGGDSIPGLVGAQIGRLSRPMFHRARDKCRAQA
jgi:hypothetical protein